MTNNLTYDPERALEEALQSNGLTFDADRIFLDWPKMRAIAVRFCHYVSPFVLLADETAELLMDRALIDAVREYHRVSPSEPALAMRAFIEALLLNAVKLANYSIAARNKADEWEIWNYDVPLLDWMQRKDRGALKIRRRKQSLTTEPILIKLASNICSITDLQNSGVSLTALSARLNAQG